MEANESDDAATASALREQADARLQVALLRCVLPLQTERLCGKTVDACKAD